MEVVISQLINGLNSGSIYALVAIGYTMVYGIIRLINFAHGEMMMIGAYTAFFVYTIGATMLNLNLPLIVVIAASMLMAALVGFLMEKVAYKKLRKAPKISALITAIGMSLFFQNLALILFSPNPKIMPALIDTTPVMFGEFAVGQLTLYTIGISTLLMIALFAFVKYTKAGKAMRSVAQDTDAASAMGIPVDNIISLTFAIGSGLGALGGVFYGLAYQQVFPTMGSMPGLKAFVAAVFGGIGNIPGAVLGGYLIGLIETFSKGFISSSFSDAIVFGVLILVLLFKPSGILGKHVKEKV